MTHRSRRPARPGTTGRGTSAPVGGVRAAAVLAAGALLLAGCGSDDHSDDASAEVARTPTDEPRLSPDLVWTGEQILVLGGYRADRSDGHPLVAGGVLVEPHTWDVTRLPDGGIAEPLQEPRGAMVGDDLLLVVGERCPVAGDGDSRFDCSPGRIAAAVLDLETGRWRTPPLPDAVAAARHVDLHEVPGGAVARVQAATPGGRDISQWLLTDASASDGPTWTPVPPPPSELQWDQLCASGVHAVGVAPDDDGRTPGGTAPPLTETAPISPSTVPTATATAWVLDTSARSLEWSAVPLGPMPASVAVVCTDDAVVAFDDRLQTVLDIEPSDLVARPVDARPAPEPIGEAVGADGQVLFSASWAGAPSHRLDLATGTWSDGPPAPLPWTSVWTGDAVVGVASHDESVPGADGWWVWTPD